VLKLPFFSVNVTFKDKLYVVVFIFIYACIFSKNSRICVEHAFESKHVALAVYIHICFLAFWWEKVSFRLGTKSIHCNLLSLVSMYCRVDFSTFWEVF
jgi:hypothetical protein